MTEYEKGWRDCYKEFVQLFKKLHAERVTLGKPAVTFKKLKPSQEVKKPTQSKVKNKKNNGEARA